jgi:hypothetical protein
MFPEEGHLSGWGSPSGCQLRRFACMSSLRGESSALSLVGNALLMLEEMDDKEWSIGSMSPLRGAAVGARPRCC